MIITREKLAQLIDEEFNKFDKDTLSRGCRMIVETEEEHEGDPRWDDHADPTGRNWDSGLDEGDEDELDEAGARKGGGRASLGFGIPEEGPGYGEEVDDRGISTAVGEAFYKEMSDIFAPEHLKKGTLDRMRHQVEAFVHDLIIDLM